MKQNQLEEDLSVYRVNNSQVKECFDKLRLMLSKMPHVENIPMEKQNLKDLLKRVRDKLDLAEDLKIDL